MLCSYVREESRWSPESSSEMMVLVPVLGLSISMLSSWPLDMLLSAPLPVLPRGELVWRLGAGVSTDKWAR